MKHYIDNKIIFTYIGVITHIVAAIIPLTWLHATTEYTPYPSVGLLLICIAMGLLPDIDTKASTIGRVIPEVSGPIEHYFGHRTITHSLIAVVTVGILAILGDYVTGYEDWFVITAAYSTHLVVDMIVGGSVGIKLFYPFTLSAKLGNIKGESTTELVFMYVLTIIAVIPLLIPIVAQSVDNIIPVAPTATPRPTIELTPLPTPIIISVSNVELQDIIVVAGDVITVGQELTLPPTPSPTFQLILVPTPRYTPTPIVFPTKLPTPTPTGTHSTFVQHEQPADNWNLFHDNVNIAKVNMNLAESEATAQAAPPSAQQINSVCNTIPSLELKVVSDMKAICEQTNPGVAESELNAAKVSLSAAQANYDLAYSPPSGDTVKEICNNVISTIVEQQRVNAAELSLRQLQAPIPISTKEAACNTVQLMQSRDRVKRELAQLQAPIPISTKETACNTVQLVQSRDRANQELAQLQAPIPYADIEESCNTVQLVQKRDRANQELAQLQAPIPISTKEAACFTEDLKARRDSAQVKLNALSGSVPELIREACWRKVYALDNKLYQAQIARDAKIASDPEADWNTLQAPLLEMEDVIEYETSLCQLQDAIESVGEPHEISAAGSDLLVAERALSRQVAECNAWAKKVNVGDEWEIEQARVNVSIAQSELDNQALECTAISNMATVGNEWEIEQARGNVEIAQSELDNQDLKCTEISNLDTVGDEWEIEQARVNVEIAQAAIDNQNQQCESTSAVSMTGSSREIALAEAAVSSAKIALTSAELNISNQRIACDAIKNKAHSVSEPELIAINANLQAAKSRVSAAQLKVNDIHDRNNTSAMECQELGSEPTDGIASERVTRVRLLQLEIEQQKERCENIRNQPHYNDEYTMAVAQKRLDVARVAYESARATPTAVTTWTPIPTPTSTPYPSLTPSVTPTITPTPTPTTEILEGIISQVSGKVVKVELSDMTDNNASVQIHVVPEVIAGLSSIVPDVTAAQSSGAITTLFTKGSVDVENELIKHIDAAYESIDVALFELNLTRVAQAIINAKARGVQIRMVTDDEHGLEKDTKVGHGQFAMIQSVGISVVDDNRGGLMHNKFWIFDKQRVWTGSTNITKNGTQKNNNNVLIMNGSAVVEVFQREFDEMFAGQFGPRSPSQQRDQNVVLGGIPVEILFGPEDSVIGRLAGLIMSAEFEVKFMAFSFTHDEVGSAMLSAKRKGVNVSGIFEVRGSETIYSELPAMQCAHNIPVKVDGNPNTMHHKVIIIDKQIVITGSFNFSKNAATNNDENLSIIWSPEIAAMYLAEFDRLWEQGKQTNYSCSNYKK